VAYFLGNAAEQQTSKPTKSTPSDNDQIDFIRFAVLENQCCRIAILDDSVHLGGALLLSLIPRLAHNGFGDTAQHVRFCYTNMLDVLQFFQVWRNPVTTEVAHDVKKDDVGSALGSEFSAIGNGAFGVRGPVNGDEYFPEHD
jgi:hypothetical protein